MSYEEKGQWVYLAATTIGYSVYLVLLLGGAGTTPLTEVDYQPILLWTIVAAIAASIIGRIAIEILSPSESHSEDVRDRESAVSVSTGPASSSASAWSSRSSWPWSRWTGSGSPTRCTSSSSSRRSSAPSSS